MTKDRDKVGEIAGQLTFLRGKGAGCTLLIGAGCSRAAGIPLASEFIGEVKELLPDIYRRIRDEEIKRLTERGEIVDEESFVPSYPRCMGQLAPHSRRMIFEKFVHKAKINWAHICIASLVKEGYVDRILTTNFDSLIMQACALLGEYPAVYDFAASQTLDPQHIPAKAVFHLHGQQTGFVQLIDEEDFTEHYTRLGPLMQASRGRVWIVVGYSGQNDPVFEHMAKFNPLQNDMYWIGYMDDEPPDNIREKLLNKKNAHYIKGHDAESFFESLTTKLGIFPPDLIARPFSHLEKTLEYLAPKEDLLRETRQNIKLAIGQFEKPYSISILTGDFMQTLSSGVSQQQIFDDIQALIAHASQNQGTQSDRLAWACLVLGNLLSNQARMKRGVEADNSYAQAADWYQKALGHKPNYYEALNNWGVSLYNQAKTKIGGAADQLFSQAADKFQEALGHNSNYCEARNNWGAALYEQALNKESEKAVGILAEAVKNFDVALEIKRNLYQAYNNLGNAIMHQLKFKSQEDAERLFKTAKENFENALLIESGQLQVLNNLGRALLDRHRSRQDESEDAWEELADEIFKISGLAERSKRGGGAYLSACLHALSGNDLDCKEWLKKARKTKTLPAILYLLSDPNLESVRDTEWFRAFIAEISKDDDDEQEPGCLAKTV